MDFDFTNEIIVPDTASYISFGGTVGVELATGSTGQRSNVPGILRYNSTTLRNEQYYGTTWANIGSGDGSVTSVGFTDASTTPIYTVNNSPVTTTGTLTITLNAQAKNTLFAGPASGTNAQPTFRTISLLQNDLSDVVLTSPANNQVLTYQSSSSKWVNKSVGSASYNALVGPLGTISWSLVSGNKYNATITHNLGTTNVVVMAYDIATTNVVMLDQITISSGSAIVVQVNGTGVNLKTISVTIIANGAAIAAGASTPSSVLVTANGTTVAGGPFTTLNIVGYSVTPTGASGVATVNVGGGVTSLIAGSGISVSGATGAVTVTNTLPPVQYIRSLTYYATSLDSPNNTDWAVNALAATSVDPTNNGINIRQFNSTTETGVGLSVTIPSNASNIVIAYKGRAQTAPSSAGAVQLNLYTRNIPNNAAVGAWSAPTALTSQVVPTNAFYQYYTQTLSLASISLIAGNLYQFEITRNVSVAGNITGNWLLAEITISFT